MISVERGQYLQLTVSFKTLVEVGPAERRVYNCQN